MKVRKVLDLCEDQQMVGQAVDLLICEEGKLGRNVIVNNRYEGLIFKNQQTKILERGQEMKGYVSVVRPDGKLDIRLEPITFEKYDEASQFILDELTKVKVLPLSDRSSPEEIREQLGMSKKTFKQAIGKLYRWKKIIIKDDCIELNG
jgi:predicted RNA-binding protein (virulence factor B family)